MRQAARVEVSFNTCSSCEEQLSAQAIRKVLHQRFNTCSSCEEQLVRPLPVRQKQMFQYMLLLRGATCTKRDMPMQTPPVSIHAPLARSNSRTRPRRPNTIGFNTCSSCEEQPAGTTIVASMIPFQYMLLLRGATSPIPTRSGCSAFQYMLLLRGATGAKPWFRHVEEFQYMLLLRGATKLASGRAGTMSVSIHAPLARSNLPRIF